MTQSELPHVKEAIGYRELYYSNEAFLAARRFTADLLGFDSGKTLDGIVYGFLKNRKIIPNEKPEILAKRKEDEVRLLGATFHFARKFFTTSHDLGEGIDPAPLVAIVVDALQASGNTHATKLLDEISSVSSKNQYPQGQAVAVISQVLPQLIKDYSTALSAITARHPKGTTQYDAEKAKVDIRQRGLLDKIIPYINEVTKSHQDPSIEGFRKYAGKLNDVKPRNGITEKYILDTLGKTRVSAKPGEDHYSIAIRWMNAESGPIVGVQYQSHAGRPTAEIKIYVGNDGNPNHTSLIIDKSRANRDLHTALLGICDHVLGSVPKSSTYWGITLEAKDMLQKWVKTR